MAQAIPTIKFSVYQGDTLVSENTFQRDVINIGKLSRSHLRLDDDNISRMHAVVEVTRTGEVDVADLGSTNGTFVNGEKISRARLQDGDEITLGGTRIVVHIAAPAAQASAGRAGKAAASGGARRGRKKASRRNTPPAINPATYLDPTPPEDGVGRLSLEIAQVWGKSLIDVKMFRSPTPITIGEKVRDTYKMSNEVLGADQLTLVRPADKGFALNIGSELLHGDIRVGSRVMPVEEARKLDIASGGLLPFAPDTRARLQFGDLTLLVGLIRPPKKPKRGLLAQINVQEQVYLALSLVLHLAFLILLSLIPEDQLRASKDPRKERSSLIAAIQVADEEKKKEEEEEQAKEEDKNKPKFEVEEKEIKEFVEKEKDPTPTIVVEKKEKKPEGLTSKLTPKEIKERNKQIVQNAGLNKVLNQTDLLANVMGGSGQLLGEGKKGMKILGSNAAGDTAYDTGNMNPFGGSLTEGGVGGNGGFAGNLSSVGGGTGGPGGGGVVAGLSKEEAGGNRKVNVAFKDNTHKIKVTVTDVTVTGELDKATVRRVIQSHIGQIKWCYQKELQKNPDLGGKVVLSFLIAANGSTVNPGVSVNTMATPAVGQCIAQKASRWTFPSPRNGGVVKVSYPFLFKAK